MELRHALTDFVIAIARRAGSVARSPARADNGEVTSFVDRKASLVMVALLVGAAANRFGRHSFFDCPILESTRTTLVSSGDVWDDDGTRVPVQTHD
jgi:hypothetical protein